MKSTRARTIALVAALVSALGGSAMSAQDKYSVKVPGGLAFSEFRGYEDWQLVSISHDGAVMAAILANPAMIAAYKRGFPGNGKPFPDGSKMAKIHWNPKKLETFPAATVPATLHDVDFMVKDSKRFADSGGDGRRSTMTPRPAPSRPPPQPTSRRRRTTPSVDSPATRSCRRETTSSPITGTAKRERGNEATSTHFQLLIRKRSSSCQQLTPRP